MAPWSACSSPQTTPASTSNTLEPAPIEQWSANIGSDIATLAAQIVGRKLFVGTEEGEIVAISVADGQEKWRNVTAPGGFETSIAAGGSLVVSPDNAGNVIVYDAADGAQAAEVFADWQLDNNTSVLVADSGERFVVATTGGPGWLEACTYDIPVTCVGESFNANTGGITDGTWVDGDLYIGLSDVDALIRGPESLPFELQTWLYRREVEVVGRPSVHGDVVVSRDEEGIVFGVDVDEGELVWEFEPDGIVRSESAGNSQLLLIADTSGAIYALKPSSGNLEWRYESGDAVEGAPTLAEGVVYVGTADGSVHAIDADDGTARWVYDAGGPIEQRLLVEDGTVYVATVRGKVSALQTP